MARLVIAVVVGLGLLVPAAGVAPGDFDPGFATGGLRVDGVATFGGVAGAGAGALDGSGRLLAAGPGLGEGAIAVLRYTSAGALDTGFGVNGIASFAVGPATGEWGAQVVGMYVQGDGQIVVAGNLPGPTASGNGFLARLTGDGQGLDPSFGVGGIARVPGDSVVRSLAQDGVGRPVVAGRAYPGDVAFLARLTASGAPDPTFGNGGQVTARLGPTSFGAGGFGTLLITGSAITAATESTENEGGFVARYDSTGAPDPRFGQGGVVRIQFGVDSSFVLIHALLALPDGDVLVAGDAHGVAHGPDFIARLTVNGKLDPGFGFGGIVVSDLGLERPPNPGWEGSNASALAIEPHGGIALAGVATGMERVCFAKARRGRRRLGCTTPTTDRLAIARYTPTGTPDCSFGIRGVAHYTLQPPAQAARITVAAAFVDPEDRLLIAGADNGFLAARFLLNGGSAQTPARTAPGPRSTPAEFAHIIRLHSWPHRLSACA